jgi:methyl-accepting chemotaxis protein
MKSIFLKLFISYIVILFVSLFFFDMASYLLFQNNLINMHPNLDRDQVYTVVHLLALSSIISITITGLFAYYLSKRITAPLREMNRVALQFARGQFDQRAIHGFVRAFLDDTIPSRYGPYRSRAAP